ncbi:MAG: aminotransferase class I/II-fold pyridoxal phosphate-dependent enzyme [Acidobacteria bacterium]|nr:aminotransferase class I/II-fold pyridoxal phosphate-dependent enzyme [Acidobacteriota bacterium]
MPPLMTRTASPASRAAMLKPTAINTILAEVREVRSAGKAVTSLMRGEPDFPTPSHICSAATQSLASGRTTYPDNRGEPGLRDAIAVKLRRDNGLTYDPATEILVTTGATLGIHTALMALVSEGDGVLIPDPVYDAYQSPILLAGGVIQPVRASIVQDRFVLTREALEAAATPSSRVLILNTPWNPAGTVLRAAELREISEFALRRNITVVSDEIYEAVVYEDHRHVSPASLSDEMHSSTVLVNSLSKTYAMTGWRVGYCAASASVISSMLLVLQQSSRGPATFVQDAAAVALMGSQEAVKAMQHEYAARRARVLAAMDGLPRVRALPPEGGFFVMVDVRSTGIPSNDIRRRLLNDHGVAVVHGSAYGPGGEGTLRVSFASGGNVLSEGLDKLREGLARL